MGGIFSTIGAERQIEIAARFAAATIASFFL
jgi:hypothetical protein